MIEAAVSGAYAGIFAAVVGLASAGVFDRRSTAGVTDGECDHDFPTDDPPVWAVVDVHAEPYTADEPCIPSYEGYYFGKSPVEIHNEYVVECRHDGCEATTRLTERAGVVHPEDFEDPESIEERIREER